MTDGGMIAGDFIGMLAGIAVFILGIALLIYWVIGAGMQSLPALEAGAVCLCAGGYLAWYFGR